MTKHANTNTLTVNPKTMDIVRRRGSKVRFFDPRTARMSGWVTLSEPKPKPAEFLPGIPADVPDYGRMRKPELQALASARGIQFNSKTTNAALIEALSA